MNKVKERLSWLERFLYLFEKAVPLMQQIADIEKLKTGDLPVSPMLLAESSLTLKPILQALRHLPKTSHKEFTAIQKEFETAVIQCIKAAEASARYVDLGAQGKENRMVLSTIINAIVLASEYFNSVSQKIAPLWESKPIDN